MYLHLWGGGEAVKDHIVHKGNDKISNAEL